MTSLRFGLSMCVAGLLAAGCPADDGNDDGNDDASGTDDNTTAQDSTTSPADSTSGGPTTELRHSTDIQPIWNAHCTTSCHEPGGAFAIYVDLSEGAYDRIVNVASYTIPGIDFIEPGDTEASYIWHKIRNTQMSVAGGNGDGMPYPSSNPPTVLTQEEIDTIEEWILGGAPE